MDLKIGPTSFYRRTDNEGENDEILAFSCPIGSLDGSFLIIFSVQLKVDSQIERREPIKMPCPINT